MGRPPKDIKYRLDTGSGRYMVSFAQSPDTYHMTPENDREKALAWARRMRPLLLAAPEKPLLMSNLAPGFFDADGAWYRDLLKKGRGMTAASLRIRQGHIGNYIIPLFGHYDIRELSGSIINRAILDAERYTAREGSTTKTSRKPLARGTRSKLLYSIKLMYDYWICEGLARENPTAGIVKYSKEPERPRSTLPEDALARLFPPTHGELVQVWGSTMNGALACVLYDTGARGGEVRARRWRDYNPEERYLPLDSAIEAGTAAAEKSTKNNVIKPGYLSIRADQELRIWRAESRHHGDDDYIFIARGNAPISNAGIENFFKNALKHLGYDATGWTPYWLRHTFATQAMEALSLPEIAELAGNSEAVNRAYRHPSRELMLKRTRGSRDKLDKMREPKKGAKGKTII